MTEFNREDRYVVLKRKDLERLPVLMLETLWDFLEQAKFTLPKRQYVVVESDWPEYETVFKMLEARMTGKSGAVGFSIQQRAEELVNKAFMPWREAEELALSERGIGSAEIVELQGNCTSSDFITGDEIPAFVRSILVHGHHLVGSLSTPCPVDFQKTESNFKDRS